ncbi:Leucine-rich repeat transmembrane neuronal protein 2 [Cyphomyrmex costatus]|uniref:Leucine-rich repeat transmembrane neuronal protein 2 n=2 Tax=Cyphomyrmex costatus TaxID=456900 RepID=A0A195D771_9HYME|nr:Leucine-rich repeat transmembrane neuronal protein 2 [Cyphomyrmex costatus]
MMISNLSLADNVLVVVPDVCSIFYLKNLDLSGNRISAVFSGSFCVNLRTLEYLHLSNNVITTIETRAFRNLQSLKYLDLSGNRLKQLPVHWIYPWIQELHLERNNFTDLNSISLINIKELKNIYLDENPMPLLTARSFHLLPGHLRIHLRNMRIEDKCAQCTCENDDNDDEKNADEDYDNKNDDNDSDTFE